MRDSLQELSFSSGATNVGFWWSPLGSVHGLGTTDLFAESSDSASLATIRLSRAAAWVLAATRKLQALGALRPGWDSYGGRSMKPEARQAAIQAIHSLDEVDLPVPGVVLAPDGTVGLEWKYHDKELDIDLGDNTRIGFVICDPDGNVKEGETGPGDRQALVGLVMWLLRPEAAVPHVG